MNWRTRTAAALAAVGCAGLGAFAASGWGEDPDPGADGGDVHQRIVHPALAADGGAAALSREASSRARKARRPKVSNLITSDPITVAANEEIVAELTCRRSQGIPLSGGAISPPAPASVAISVLSRFSPNPPFDAEPRSYFVGVRNLGPTEAQFRATLVCAKGIDQ